MFSAGAIAKEEGDADGDAADADGYGGDDLDRAPAVAFVVVLVVVPAHMQLHCVAFNASHSGSVSSARHCHNVRRPLICAQRVASLVMRRLIELRDDAPLVIAHRDGAGGQREHKQNVG